MPSSRFPTRRDLFTAFLICLFPIQAWSWFVFLYKLPSYMNSLMLGKILVIFAYLQVFALIETGLLWSLLTELAFLLPARIYRDRFVNRTLALVFSLAGWAVGMHYLVQAVETEAEITSKPSLPLAWSLAWLVAAIALLVLEHRRERAQMVLADIADRLTFPAGLYLLVDLISLAGLGVYLIVRGIG